MAGSVTPQKAEMAAAIPKDLRSFFFDLMATAKTAADSLAVMKELANRGIDLIEISGGSYERPKMMGDGQGATFIDYARRAKAAVDVPIMVTGGFRTREGIEEAVASGDTDLVGLARPLVLVPDLPHQLQAGTLQPVQVPHFSTGWHQLDRKVGR